MDYGIKKWGLALGVLVLAACRQSAESAPTLPPPVKTTYANTGLNLSQEDYHNRILGALVGSAIGDAMGASTEMWAREDIRRTYGYITSLTPAVRYQSPEGTWEHNLQAGATTDDTRWKALMGGYLSSGNPTPEAFATFISTYYKAAVDQLPTKAAQSDPDLLDAPLEQVDWIREWARVALAYQEGPEAYALARDRFYGGEMSCAGMLYTPVFGLQADSPEAAYQTAYAHTLFDLGYARDISALVAAMTRTALQTRDMDSLLNTAVFVDPLRFQDSRLVGRISLAQALAARDFVRRARLLPPLAAGALQDSIARMVPSGYPGDTDAWFRQETIYNMLEKEQMATPFHAGEIWQILIAALEFGQGDFTQTMAFIVNYGRDNDTVAAVAGMILGAQLGFDGLPEEARQKVLEVNRTHLGIDLEAVARQLSGVPMAP